MINNLKEKGSSFIKEFKSFAIKGNVIDMAIGVIIGTAFSKIVTSLVSDIIMPLLGVLVGNVDLKKLSLVLQKGKNGNTDVILSYGAFLQTIFDFIIIAVSIFFALKILLKIKKAFIKAEEDKKEKALSKTDELLTEILAEIKRKDQK